MPPREPPARGQDAALARQRASRAAAKAVRASRESGKHVSALPKGIAGPVSAARGKAYADLTKEERIRNWQSGNDAAFWKAYKEAR